MLRERTQRRLFRVLFVLGCVLPTLAVAVFAVNRVTPAFSNSLLERLSERLGCRLACDRLSTPRPGRFVLSGVRAADPRSGQDLLTASTLRVARQDGRWQVSAVDVHAASVTAAATVLQRLTETGLDADLRIERLTLGSAPPLAGVSMKLSAAAKGARKLEMTSREGMRLVARLGAGAWSLEADTGGQPIPADWLPGVPLAAATATSFDFFGSLRAECSRDGASVRGVATGRFEIDRLDLRQLLADHGTLSEVDLRWTHERIERLNCRLTLREGQLSRSLVEGAAQWLQLKPSDTLLGLYNDPTETLAWFPFTQIACETELGPDGLVLVARNDQIDGENRSGLVAHAIVEYGGEPLLGEPLAPNLSVQNLVQAWFADQRAELPASHAALELARRLPRTTQR